jgi:hypothetical protein
MILNVNPRSLQYAHGVCCTPGCSEDGRVFAALVPSARGKTPLNKSRGGG